MPLHKKRYQFQEPGSSGMGREDKDVVVTDTQEGFGYGQIREEYWGKSTSEEFRKGVKRLINWDINQTKSLVKRTGAVEDNLFVPWSDKRRRRVDGDVGFFEGNVSFYDDFTEERRVVDFKLEEFGEIYILAVNWFTGRYYYDPNDPPRGQQAGHPTLPDDSGFTYWNRYTRNDILLYVGFTDELESRRARNTSPSARNSIFRVLGSRGVTFRFFDDLRFTSVLFDNISAAGTVLRLRYLDEFMNLLVFHFDGGSELSASSLEFSEVRKDREYLVTSQSAYPVSISRERGGELTCGSLGLKPVGFSVAGRDTEGSRIIRTFVGERSYYECGYQNNESAGDITKVGTMIFEPARSLDSITRDSNLVWVNTFEGNAAYFSNNRFKLRRAGTRYDDPATDLTEAVAKQAMLNTVRRRLRPIMRWGRPITRSGNMWVKPSDPVPVEMALTTLSGVSTTAPYSITLKNNLSLAAPLYPDLDGFPAVQYVEEPFPITYLGSVSGRREFMSSRINLALNSSSSTIGTCWVPVQMSGTTLDRCVFSDQGVGELLVYLEERDATNTVLSTKAFLCTVIKYNGFLDIGSANNNTHYTALFQFYTQDAMDGLEFMGENKGLGFRSIDSMLYTVLAADKFNVVSFPGYSVGGGFPANAQVVDQRTMLSGFGNNRILASGTHGVAPATSFSSRIPEDLKFDGGMLDNVTAGKGSILTPPSSQATPDEFFYFNLQLDQSRVPFELEPQLGRDNEVFWVNTLRGIIFGTRVEETRVLTFQNAPLNKDNASTTTFQSARGSGSHLTAKGDYSLFFVGPNGDEIFYFWFDDGISGLRSRAANVIGGDLDTIRDMLWDYRRKALWVIHGDGEIALFFMSREYDIMGWTEYRFEDLVDGALVPRYKASTLFHNRDRSVGFTAEGGYLVTLPYSKEEGFGDFADPGGNVVSRVEFFRNPPASRTGAATIWQKRASRTELFTRNFTEIFKGGRSREDSVNMIRDVKEVNPFGVYNYALDGIAVSILRDEKLLYSSVEHRKNERAEILSISGRYEIKEH